MGPCLNILRECSGSMLDGNRGTFVNKLIEIPFAANTCICHDWYIFAAFLASTTLFTGNQFIRSIAIAISRSQRFLCKPFPHFENARTPTWKHTVLQTIQALTVDGRNKSTCDQTQDDTW